MSMPSNLHPDLEATVSACVESALALHRLTAPRVRSIMAADEVIVSYIQELGFGDRIIPWKRVGRETDPDLILAHQVAGGTSLCPAWLPKHLEPRLTLIPAAHNSEQVCANLRRFARVLGCIMAEMVPAQHFRERFEGLRAGLPKPGPRVLVLTETAPGRYRFTNPQHSCHQILGSLGWISAPRPGISDKRVSHEDLKSIEHDAVLVLEAWSEPQPGMARHWPLMVSEAAKRGHWHTESVLTFLCLGPLLPRKITEMALRFGVYPYRND